MQSEFAVKTPPIGQHNARLAGKSHKVINNQLDHIVAGWQVCEFQLAAIQRVCGDHRIDLRCFVPRVIKELQCIAVLLVDRAQPPQIDMQSLVLLLEQDIAQPSSIVISDLNGLRSRDQLAGNLRLEVEADDGCRFFQPAATRAINLAEPVAKIVQRRQIGLLRIVQQP